MKKCLLILVCYCFFSDESRAVTRYVKPGGAGSKSGSSWTDAADDLQAMINIASVGDQLWVATGTYKPLRRADATGAISADDRNNAFVLKKDIALYGGFAGGESLLSERDIKANPTLLSGDIGTTGDSSDNCYHVVISAGDIGNTVLDGFSIMYGNANDTGAILVNGTIVYRKYGGGIFNSNTALHVLRCSVAHNTAFHGGGGIFNFMSAAPVFTDCIISYNSANFGGGVCNLNRAAPAFKGCSIAHNIAGNVYGAQAPQGGGCYSSRSFPVITDCVIADNVSFREGGGIYDDSDSAPVISGCTIMNNKAIFGAGVEEVNTYADFANTIIKGNQALPDDTYVVSSGGGIECVNSTMHFEACTISGNVAATGWGGGLLIAGSSVTMNRCVISGNLSDQSGGGLNSYAGANLKLINCLVVGNKSQSQCGGLATESKATVVNSIILDNLQGIGGTSGSDVLSYSSGVEFYNAVVRNAYHTSGFLSFYNSMAPGLDTANGNKDLNAYTSATLFMNAASGDYRPVTGSPCIDAGNNDYYGVISTDKDLAGNARLSGSAIDIGPYEWSETMSIPNPEELMRSICVYPNPVAAGGLLYLDIQDKTQYDLIQLLDASGSVVGQVAPKGNKVSLPSPALPGIYLLRIYAPGGLQTTKKIMVE